VERDAEMSSELEMEITIVLPQGEKFAWGSAAARITRGVTRDVVAARN
jgi:hypothetical protein